jgi:flavorubredoxin
MRPLQIAKGIYNVGAIDWNIRDFHGYSTYNGTTYNAFLIVDEKIALIDTVKKEFSDELIRNISSIIDPRNIDFVVSNHAEMDHSGCLTKIMHIIGKDKPVYCSKMGAKNLAAHFQQKINYQVVEKDTKIDLGLRTLSFMETRMLHWPDSMFTYIPEDRILFSSDAFGQHYAGHENFDDELGRDVTGHARKYYANILLPYSDRVGKLIASIADSGLEIKMICPDHGVIWRSDPGKIIQDYVDWSMQKPGKKAVILYETMWHSTEKMANEIASGLNAAGIDATPMHARKWHRSDIMTELMDARALVVGSPTLNNGLFPTLSDVLTYIKGLKPKNKLGAAFGSYGWSGEAVKIINGLFNDMEIDIIDDGFRTQYVPNDEVLKKCFEYGKMIGEKIVSDQEN